MNIREQLLKIAKPIRELLGRLSRSQRISLAVLGVVVAVGMALLVFTTPASARMIPTGERFTPELNALFEKCGFKSGVDYRPAANGELQVRADAVGAIYGQIFAQGTTKEQEDQLQWLYREMTLGTTSGHTQLRLNDSQRRRMQMALMTIDGVARAEVFVNKRDSSFLLKEDSSSTASVQLVLDPGTEKLPLRHAHGAAKMVASAWGIPLARVTVTDDHGNHYNLDEQELADGDGRDLRERNMVAKLSRLFDKQYAPNEYVVIAKVEIERTTKEKKSVSYDADKSLNAAKRRMEESQVGVRPAALSPGTKANVGGFGSQPAESIDKSTFTRTEEELENFAATTEESSTTPAGEELKWSILAHLSKSAVKRVLQQNMEINGVQNWNPTPDELEASIKQQLAKVKDDLAQFVFPEGNVTVDYFIPPPPPALVTSGDGSGVLGFLGAHAREMVLALLSLFACVLLYRIASGSAPMPEALPDPVAELAAFLREKEEKEQFAFSATAAPGVQKRVANWEAPESERASIQLLQDVSEYATTRPEIAASVLRLWLNEEATNKAESAEREPETQDTV